MKNRLLKELNKSELIFVSNSKQEFLSQDIDKAKHILNDYLNLFVKIKSQELYEDIASLMLSIKINYQEFNEYGQEDHAYYYNRREKFRSELDSIRKILQAMYSWNKRANESIDELFPFDEVVFKSKLRKEEIVVDGAGLFFMHCAFYAFDQVFFEEDIDKIKAFSPELAELYTDNKSILNSLNEKANPLKKGIVGAMHHKRKTTSLNRYRNQIAFFTHNYLKRQTNNISANIPEWHKKVIGEIFIYCGIAHFEKENTIGFVGDYYNSVRRWIEEGEKLS